MPILTKYATAHNSGWTNGNNALASNGLYATATPAKNGTTTIIFSNFGFDEIPVGSTINSLLIEAYWKVSTTGSVDTLGAVARVDDINMGTEFTTTTLTTAMKLDSTSNTGSYTRDDLVNGSFTVAVRATRGNTNTAFTASLDYVRVTVNYTEPLPEPPVINIVDFSATKLSRITGKNEISITFSSNKNLSEWEVRADGAGVGGGDLIASGGAVSANVNFTVSGIQLTWGDKTYRINVYGKSTEGLWNQ